MANYYYFSGKQPIIELTGTGYTTNVETVGLTSQNKPSSPDMRLNWRKTTPCKENCFGWVTGYLGNH